MKLAIILITAIVIVNVLLVIFWYFFKDKEDPSVESIELDKLYVCIKESDLLRCKIGKLYRFSRESYDAQDANGYDVLDKDYHIYQGECVSLEYIQEHFRLATADEISEPEPTTSPQEDEKPVDEPEKPVCEPKFKIGDWVVFENSTERLVLQIANIRILPDIIQYVFTDKSWCNGNKEFRLWTIADAKDGDVLSYVTDEEDLWIMIYRSLYEPYEGHVHYHALLVNDNFDDKGTCCICIDNLKPATKEQKEILFMAMKETGYQWDAETKTLSKIEEPQTNEPVVEEPKEEEPSEFEKTVEYFSQVVPIGPKIKEYLKSLSTCQTYITEEAFPVIFDYYGEIQNEHYLGQFGAWLVGLVLTELIPEKRQQLIQMAYDYGVKGAEQPTYEFTFETDPNVVRMIASIVYATTRDASIIPELRKELNGKMLTYKNDVSEIYIDTTKFMPTAPSPFIKGYEKRPKGTPVDADNTASVDEQINDYVAQYYNLDTKDAEKRQETIQAIANKEYHKQHLFGKDRIVTDKKYGSMTIRPVFGKHNIGIEIPDDGVIANLVYNMGKICSATRISLLDQEYGRRRPGMGDTDGSMNPDPKKRALVNYAIEEGDGHTTGYYDKGGYYVDGNGNYIGDYETYYQGQLYANSYPSGHSAYIMGVAMLLMEVMPDRADKILQADNEFANSRVICRYHHTSDTIHGRVIGSMMIPILHATTNYNLDELVKQAKEEYERIKNGGTPEPSPVPSDEKVNTSLAYSIGGYGSCHVDTGEKQMIHCCTKQCSKERHPSINVNQRVEFTLEGGITTDDGKTSGVWEANKAYGIKCPAVTEDKYAFITMRNENGVKVLRYRMSLDGTHDDGALEKK